MGFIRQQEEKLAIKLLRWHYQRTDSPQPVDSVIEEHAKQVVEDAHRIAKERGRNVLSIIRELIDDLRKK